VWAGAVANLTVRIKYLVTHLITHRKDKHTRYSEATRRGEPLVCGSVPRDTTPLPFPPHLPRSPRSRRGLLGLVQQRRQLLQYLKRKNFVRYTELLQQLGIRPVAGTR
jgi:ribosomal protein S15P/S13E